MMKLFWRIATAIYCELFSLGITVRKINWFFNNPNYQLENQMNLTILADTAFTSEERAHIMAATDHVNFFCNGFATITILFTLDQDNQEEINNNSILLREDDKSKLIEQEDKNHNTSILGMCYHNSNHTRKLLLVTNRLYSKNLFQITTAHELLHALFLGHTEKPSIMHAFISNNNLLFPTELDAQELVRVWGEDYYINIQDLRYFKTPVE